MLLVLFGQSALTALGTWGYQVSWIHVMKKLSILNKFEMVLNESFYSILIDNVTGRNGLK